HRAGGSNRRIQTCPNGRILLRLLLRYAGCRGVLLVPGGGCRRHRWLGRVRPRLAGSRHPQQSLAPIWKPRPFLAGVSAGSRSTGVRFPRRVGASIDGIQPYPHPFSAWIFDGEPDMRLATLVLIGVLGVGAATGSAQAAPFAPASET